MVFANKTTRCPRWWHLAVSRMCHCWAPTTLQSWDHNDIPRLMSGKMCVFCKPLWEKNYKQMIIAYNSYYTTQFFNSALSRQNNTLYWKKRSPPAALHGHVVEYVQHLSVSVSRSLILEQILRSQPHNWPCVSGVTSSNHSHGHLLQWLLAVLDALRLARSALDVPARMSQCSVAGTVYGEVTAYHTCIIPHHTTYIYTNQGLSNASSSS